MVNNFRPETFTEGHCQIREFFITDQTVILAYCATFLKPEMHHVYRQATGVRQFATHVVARRRKSSEAFPFQPVTLLRKSKIRFFRKFWHETLFRHPAALSKFEAKQLLSLRRTIGAKLVHVYFGTEALKALPYLTRETCAKIVSFHGADLSPTVTDPKFSTLIDSVDLVLCRSRSLAEDLLEGGCPHEKIHLNPTGIPTPDVQPRSLPPGCGTTIPLELLQASRLIEKKGLDLSIEALAKLRHSGINVRLTLAGDGPLRESLTKLARSLGVADAVVFPGFLQAEDLEIHYRSCHLFLHPSRTTDTGDREGIPNSMLEAMSYGLPPITTRHGGIPEAVDHEVEGILLDNERPETIAATIERIVSHPDQYDAMSRASQTRIAASFSTRKSIDKLESAYREAMKRASQRRGSEAI